MSQHAIYIETCDSETQIFDQNVSSIMANPVLVKGSIDQYTLVGLAREYVSLFDSTTKTIYLYYLMGKDALEISRLTGVTSGQAIRSRLSLINGFQQYSIERMSSKGIDIEKNEKYVDCMQLDSKMDDDQIAEAFNEDMLTTKIMKHFVRKADVFNNLFLMP